MRSPFPTSWPAVIIQMLYIFASVTGIKRQLISFALLWFLREVERVFIPLLDTLVSSFLWNSHFLLCSCLPFTDLPVGLLCVFSQLCILQISSPTMDHFFHFVSGVSRYMEIFCLNWVKQITSSFIVSTYKILTCSSLCQRNKDIFPQFYSFFLNSLIHP